MSSTYVSAELRRLVCERSNDCCEYCLLPQTLVFLSHEIDHITAEKHGGETVPSNLAWSCALCNKHKGTDLTSLDPLTGAIEPLFHPRNDRWSDHFRFHEGHIEPLTPTGRATAQLLQFNVPERVAERLVLLESGQLKSPE